MAVMALIAALMTPNSMEELNLRWANLTAVDSTVILDAARSYRVANVFWPCCATCSTAINVLKKGGYLAALSTDNRYNNPITTSCDSRTFSVAQSAVADWVDYLVNSIAGSEITTAATHQMTSTISVPGSEPALSNKLASVATGNQEDNRMRTTLLMRGQQINEAGNINFAQAIPTIRALKGSRRLSARLSNFVHIGTYIVRDGWLVQKPVCATGGVPKGALRPTAMRGGYMRRQVTRNSNPECQGCSYKNACLLEFARPNKPNDECFGAERFVDHAIHRNSHDPMLDGPVTLY